MPHETHLRDTKMLDFTHSSLQELIRNQAWNTLVTKEKIGAAYEFTRNQIRFGYNRDDRIPASGVLVDGYGQCNTKATLLMALLRALGVPCRLHGFTIDKALQRGVVPELIYWMAPRNILHSWVEVWFDERWVTLEGFILDQPVLAALQNAFPKRKSLCAYGAGTDCLQDPPVRWDGTDTYIQHTGINADLGIFDSPDAFYAGHRQDLTGLRGLLYRCILRHWMNHRVKAIRQGRVPYIPGGARSLSPTIEPASAAFDGKSRPIPKH